MISTIDQAHRALVDQFLDMLAAEALKIMEDHRINALVVVDEEDRPVGAFNLSDLLRAGVM